MPIIIDTNVFYKKCFNFSSNSLYFLPEQCDVLLEFIYISDIQKLEIQKKIKEFSSEKENEVLSKVRKLWPYANNPDYVHGSLQRKLDAAFDEFLRYKCVKTFKGGEVDIVSLMGRLKDGLAPFKQGRQEFVDAFIIDSARNLPGKRYFVSEDKLALEYAKERGYETFGDIISLLSGLFLSADPRHGHLESMIKSISDEIKSTIVNKYNGYWVSAPDALDSDLIASLKSDDILIKNDIRIVGRVESAYRVALCVTAIYKVTGTYVDLDCAAYDSEDKEYIPLGSKEFESDEDITGDIIIDLLVNKKTLEYENWDMIKFDDIEIRSVNTQDDHR